MGRFARRETHAAWVGGSIARAAEQAEVARDISNVDGWMKLEPVEHMCFPPEVYPRGAGSGSQWVCRPCGAIWQADGCQIIGSYPEPGSKHEQAIGPLRWIHVDSAKSDKQIDLEMDLYDWRSTVFYNARLLRRLIELNGGTWEDV